jgi:hypothetical protein
VDICRIMLPLICVSNRYPVRMRFRTHSKYILAVSTENSRTMHTDGSASSTKENSALAAGIDTREHAVSVPASQPPSADENRTETMHEGLEGVRKDNHIPGKPKSPRKVTLVSMIQYVNDTLITKSRLG